MLGAAPLVLRPTLSIHLWRHGGGRKARTMSRADLTKLVLRLKRRARRTAKQSVLPWSVEIWGGDRKPFASYTFQAEGPARAFASRLGDALDLTPTERVEPADQAAHQH